MTTPKQIIESKTEPNTNQLWYNPTDKSLKVFDNGWQDIISNNSDGGGH